MRTSPEVRAARPTRPTLGVLAAAAQGSGGMVTVSQASALGFHGKRLQRLVVQGILIREERGVYRFVGSEPGVAKRALAATTRVRGVASHQTACQLWGYRGPGFRGEATHVTVEYGTRTRRKPGLVMHRTRRKLGGFTTRRDGVETTRPLRTILDVAGEAVTDEELRGLLEYCVSERLLMLGSLERFVSTRKRGVRGARRLRRVVEAISEVDSVAEAELVNVLVAAGIERPVTQFVVRENGHFLGRVDLAWPSRHVALELDGYRYHSDLRTFVGDRERGNRIVASGWVLLRTTPTTVSQAPHRVVADVRAALGRPSTAA